jgi:hypothetical protein
MGDGTGCDNMTAVIAKLKPGALKAFLNPKASKTEVKTGDGEDETVKRPAEEELSSSEKPKAKKAREALSEEK